MAELITRQSGAGSEMIVWGGQITRGDLNTGGRYNPSTDSWATTSTTNAPAARDSHTAIWSGSRDDCLGRRYFLELVQQRRKILRATWSHTYTNGGTTPQQQQPRAARRELLLHPGLAKVRGLDLLRLLT